MPTRTRVCALVVFLAAAVAWPQAARALSAEAADAEAAALPAAQADAGLEAPESEEALFDATAMIAEPDPLEGMNRALFGFNEEVDRFLMEPLARAYGFVLPGPAKRAVLRVFSNLNAPVIFVNDVLQLAPRRAGVTLGRFVVNSTVGIVGILDVATRIGLEGHHSDFGQTLGVAGVPTGPYLVLPIAGPSSARDAVGGVVDLAFRPQTYFLGPIDLLLIQSSDGVATREAYIEKLEKLRATSLDFYATMRNVYFQRRAEIVREGRGDGRRSAPEPEIELVEAEPGTPDPEAATPDPEALAEEPGSEPPAP